MSKRIKQEDIAKELGLSINTVSLALKGSTRINEETRAKVHQVAKALNYIPNTIARSLVQKKTNMIGFILPNITNPIQIEVAQQIERKLITHGYNLMVMTTDGDKDYEASALDIMLSRQVDGIFLFPTDKQNQEKIGSLRAANHPVILLSGGNYSLASDSIYMNQFSGAYLATGHLARLGHRMIGLIDSGGPNSEKHRGYKQALNDHGLTYSPEKVIMVNDVSYAEGYAAASGLFTGDPVSAILAANDNLAIGALRWCREKGMRVPEDAAIVGFDDLEASRFAEVPLTSVAYKIQEITTQAVERLFHLLQDRKTMPPPVRVEVEPSLVIRKSCGYRQDD